jgi:hypothetical protein
MTDQPTINPDVKRAVCALLEKKADQDLLFRYYEGDQPLVYARKKLREIFKEIDANFAENWAAVVIDACADRITLKGFAVANDEPAQSALSELWKALSLAVEADDLHETALIAAEAFLIVWRDDSPEGGGSAQACYNDPRMCHVEYDAENPKRKKWAAKWWTDDDGHKRLTLYYPDRLEYYVSSKKASEIEDSRSFLPTDLSPAPNPWGTIPVFHFRNKRDRSDLENAIPIQNAINKLVMDMMAGAEFGALPQKYAITNADTTGLKNAPGELWTFPEGDGQGGGPRLGQFTAADLGNYGKAIDGRVAALGAITSTPKHYFFQQGGDPSGESLIAMEAPLNKKAQDRIDRFVPEWRHAASFLLLLVGLDVSPWDIEPMFAEPSTVQPRTAAEVRQLDVKSGIPLRTVLRDEGWSEDELAQMDADAQAAQESQTQGLASALVAAQGRFDKGPAVTVPADGNGAGS